MISLTLLPSQSQAKLGPLHHIAGEKSLAIDPLNTKPAGGSLSFASRGHKDAASNEGKPTKQQEKVGIRLAEDAVLLPFYNRPVEVKELLLETNSKNKQLIHSVEKLFSNSNQDWDALQTLFFEIDREELGDRDWLGKIYSLVFARSPSIWCRLADCLGAHALDWSAFGQDIKDEHDDDLDSIKYDDDVFTDSGSSFTTERTHARSSSGPSTGFELEALHEVPQSFRLPPIRARRPSSYRFDDEYTVQPQEGRAQHRSLRHRRGSSVISTGEDHDVHDFLSSKVNGFAGVRLSWSYQDRRSWSPHQSLPRLPSQLHDRTINTPSYNKGSPTSTTQVRQRGATISVPQQQHKFTHHRRLSSLFTTLGNERSSPSPQKSPSQTNTKPLPDSVRPEKKTSPFSTFARSYSTPRLGLLPDGRTRHPSAGDGEGASSKEATALLAFKRELQLSGYGDNEGKGTNLSSSSLSSVLSPNLSESSFATTVSANASPETSKKSPETSLHQQQQKSIATTHSTALIFPMSSSSKRPRSKHLLDQLDRDNNIDDVSTIKSTIGQESYKRLCDLIAEKERNDCSDQLLLEHIAKDCFNLVDNEKDSREIVEAHLIDENYDKRWNAFVKLCHTWDVDSAVIREAKRRGGPALKLF